MLGKRIKPMIGKLTGSSVSGTGTKIMDSVSSPRGPFELKTHSPRGLKSYDLGGVGLGIVAALEKSGDFRREIKANQALYNMNLNRSKPIPVNSSRNSGRISEESVEEMDMDSLEEYTFVTCHGPDKKSYTKVYCDGGDYSRKENHRNDFDYRRRSVNSNRANRATVFNISPPKFGDFTAFPASDFLSSCHLCQKTLDGEDIYMYRGEKAFCSAECRYKQIAMDERKEKCGSEAASRSIDVSSDRMLSPGIFAI